MKSSITKPRISTIVLVVLITIAFGSVYYRNVENLSWIDSIYFCVMTLTTVGYGTVQIDTMAGKIFTIFYALFGVAIIAASVNSLLRRGLEHRASRGEDSKSKQG